MEACPENLIRAIGVPLINTPLSPDQFADLEAKVASQDDVHRDALLLHYRDGM